MADAAPNYNPPGGPGVPNEETWRTEAGVKTVRPAEAQPQSEAAQDDPDEERPTAHNSLGMRIDPSPDRES